MGFQSDLTFPCSGYFEVEAIQVEKNLNETREMKGTHYHPPQIKQGGKIQGFHVI